MALPMMTFLQGGLDLSDNILVDATLFGVGTNSYATVSKNLYCSNFGGSEGLTMSFWINPESYTPSITETYSLIENNYEGTSPPNDPEETYNHIRIQYNTSGQARLVIDIGNDGSSGITYTGTYGEINTGAWNHVGISIVNGGGSSTSNRVHLNGTTGAGSGSAMTGSIQHAPEQTNPTLFQRQYDFSPYSPSTLNVCYSEVWTDDTYYDLRVIANMQKFIKNNKPVSPPSGKFYIRGITSGGSHTFDQYGTETATVTTYNISECSDSPSD